MHPNTMPSAMKLPIQIQRLEPPKGSTCNIGAVVSNIDLEDLSCMSADIVLTLCCFSSSLT